MNALMAEEFAKILGSFDLCEKDAELQTKMDGLGIRMMSATGGLMRADFEVKDGKFADIAISGDFFCYPEDAIVRMERFIEGAAVDNIAVILADFLNSHDIEIPVVNSGDWMKPMKM